MALPFVPNGICWSAAALLSLTLGSCAAPPTAGGGGIVSINPCGDAMLVELTPDRIASISHYSLDPAAASIPPEVARRYRTNAGTAEEIVAMRPDLVIGDTFTSPSSRAAFARAGLKTLYLDSPVTIAGSQEQVTKLAAALGVEPAGRAMNARIDRAVAAATWEGPKVPGLLWIGGNLANGGGTLLDEMMVRAGFSNHAAHYGLQFTGTLPIEHVVIDPPRVMLVPDAPGRMASSRAAEMRERAISRTGAHVTQAHFPRSLVNCGGPVIASAMTRLAEVRRSIK